MEELDRISLNSPYHLVGALVQSYPCLQVASHYHKLYWYGPPNSSHLGTIEDWLAIICMLIYIKCASTKFGVPSAPMSFNIHNLCLTSSKYIDEGQSSFAITLKSFLNNGPKNNVWFCMSCYDSTNFLSICDWRLNLLSIVLLRCLDLYKEGILECNWFTE